MTAPRQRLVRIAFSTMSLLLLLAAGQVQAFTLSGTILDGAGNPLPKIRLVVLDRDALGSDRLATVHTGDDGKYSVILTGGWGVEAPDVYITVDWRFQLVPAARYGNHEVAFRGVDSISFVSEQTTPVSDHDPSTDLIIDHNMQQMEPNLGALRQRVNEIIDYYENNKGDTPWSVTYDIPVTVITTRDSFARGEEMFIARNDVLGTGAMDPVMLDGNVVDIYHEVGHVIHYHFQGGTLPPFNPRSHNIRTESDPGFAVVEGWPSFVATLAAEANGIMEMKHREARDLNFTNWRGDEVTAQGTAAGTGYDSGRFESGEIVEGAVGGVYFEMSQMLGFAPIFKAMVTGRPNNIQEFINQFIATGGDAGGAYRTLYRHGIPFARARFEGDVFQMDDPPEAAPGDSGNAKLIDNKLFLRGEVSLSVSALAGSDLGVQNTVNLDNVRIGYKGAVAGTGEPSTAFAQFSPVFPFGGSIPEWDTLKLGGMNGDGEWDLVIVGGATSGLLDTLFPFWMGDPTVDVNSDERYLKKTGTWYDKDRNPMTEDDGKVIVDNTAPKVENFKP